MRLAAGAVAAALLLNACAATGLRRHLLVTDTSHGPVVWSRFKTLEACERASREDEQAGQRSGLVTPTRCTTRSELRRRR